MKPIKHIDIRSVQINGKQKNTGVRAKIYDEDGNIIDTLYIKLDGIITDNEDIERMTVEELTKKHYPVTDNVEIE